jgi:probable addiction module antidote protein
MIDKSSMESIGKEIREIVKRKKISFYRIAKDLGIAQESLYRSLHDDGNPRWETIKKVLHYLECDIIIKPNRKEGKLEKSKPSRSRRHI